MGQRDERVKLLEQSLHNISKCIEALQIHKPVSSREPSQLMHLELLEDMENR